MDADVISVIVALVGCFVGLAGWLSGRDKKIVSDGEWKGSVDTKLDDIRSSVSGTSMELSKINAALSIHGERITATESSVKQAHHRIDEINEKLENK